jgi:hypothetical protein
MGSLLFGHSANFFLSSENSFGYYIQAKALSMFEAVDGNIGKL